MIILKSRIKKFIDKVRARERALIGTDWQRKIDTALYTQKELFEILLHEKNLEIETLNTIIDQNKKFIEDAYAREANSKKILLRAREIAACIDFEFKRYLENSARAMTQFDKIRNDTDIFTKKLLSEKL